MAHYKNHTVEIQDTADGAATVIGSILDASAPIEQDVQSDSTAGTYYPQQIQTVGQRPMFRYRTLDIPKVYGKFGGNGFSSTSTTGKIGACMYQALYNNDAISAGSTHRRLIFDESYSFIRRISVSHRQDATAECETMAIYDGTNNPLTFEESVALPTLPASPGRWTLASATVGSITLSCQTSVDIDFGITAELFGCDSDVWDTHLNVSDIKPTITISTLDPSVFKASSGVPLIGLAGTHANTSIKLRKRTSTGLASFVADATAEHIEITAAGVLQVTEAMNATGNQQGQITFQMTCSYDGTNHPILFDTAATL